MGAGAEELADLVPGGAVGAGVDDGEGQFPFGLGDEAGEEVEGGGVVP